MNRRWTETPHGCRHVVHSAPASAGTGATTPRCVRPPIGIGPSHYRAVGHAGPTPAGYAACAVPVDAPPSHTPGHHTPPPAAAWVGRADLVPAGWRPPTAATASHRADARPSPSPPTAAPPHRSTGDVYCRVCLGRSDWHRFFFPPPTARTDALSTTARDQST